MVERVQLLLDALLLLLLELFRALVGEEWRGLPDRPWCVVSAPPGVGKHGWGASSCWQSFGVHATPLLGRLGYQKRRLYVF